MEKKIFPNIWQAVLLFVIVTILIGIVEFCMFYVMGGVDEYKSFFYEWSPIPALGLLLAFMYLVKYRGIEIPEMTLPRISFWYYLPVLVITLRLADDPFTNIFEYWGVISKGGMRVTELFIPKEDTQLIVRFLTAVLFGPIAEELFFRAFIQRRLSMQYSPVIAIGISTLIFVIWHQDIENVLTLLLWGLLYGYMYHLTGSIIYSIALHGFGNFCIFFTSSHCYPINSDESITYLVVYALAVVALIYLMYRFRARHAQTEIVV